MIYQPSKSTEAHAFLDKLFERKRWIKIEYIPEKRSLNQNNYMWLCFTIIGQDTGNTAQDIYEYYLEKFPTYKEIEFNGLSKRIKISSSQFTVEQMTVFIDLFTTDARQEGISLPDPKDLEELNQYQYYQQRGLL